MNFDEIDFNLTDGEFSDKDSITILYGDDTYTVSGVISKRYNRKQVDGRYTTDIPLYTVMLIIAQSEIPTDIPEDNYKDIVFILQEKQYEVIFITGTSFLTFTVRPIDTAMEIV